MPLKKYRFILFTIIACAVITRIVSAYLADGKAEWSRDENANYIIASNYIDGKGYTLYDAKTQTYRQTAFHSTFPVFTYVFLQRAGIGKSAWYFFIQFASIFLFALSIIYFYKMVKISVNAGYIALLGALTYAFYPSVIYYIGSLFLYENIGMPVLVIVVYKLLAYLKGVPSRFYEAILIPLLVTISCLYRSQLLFIYAFIFFVFFALAALSRAPDKQDMKRVLRLIAITLAVLVLAHIPILKSNYTMFGSHIVSTQPGFALLQEHNPFARGSANDKWREPGNELYEYVKAKAPAIYTLDEYEESIVRGKIATEWIIKNPWNEAKLFARKIAVYFLPQNYDSLPGSRIYNPLNLVIHVLFLFSIAISVIKIRTIKITKEEIIILSPVAASLLLSVIFFVGYRWRYYAEPFMIAYILLFGQKLLNHRSGKARC